MQLTFAEAALGKINTDIVIDQWCTHINSSWPVKICQCSEAPVHITKAIATALWGSGPLGILGSYQPMSLLAFSPSQTG